MNIKKGLTNFLPIKKINSFKKLLPQKSRNDIKTIILILLSSFSFLIMWSNKNNLSPDNLALWAETKAHLLTFGGNFPYTLEGEKISSNNIKINRRSIFALSDTNLEILNTSGKSIRKSPHNFSNPKLKLNGLRAVVYDIGGKHFKIESVPKTIFEKETEKEIIAAAISCTGTYSIVTRSTSHLSELKVYNKQNVEKYCYSFSDYYITDTDLNISGSHGVISGISAENGEIISEIYLLDFKKETPQEKFRFVNNMVTEISVLSNGNILAIGDKYTSFINPKSKKVQNYYYNEKILKFYDINKYDGICFCISSSINEINNDEIVYLDINGKEIIKFETSESFSSISQRKNKILCLSFNKVILYDISGKNNEYMNSIHHAKKIILLSHSKALLLTSHTINKISIKKLKKFEPSKNEIQ